MPKDFAINVNKLEIVFDRRAVLRDFSLRLAKGEKLLLQGPSGSGKSTILLCIMGFFKPASGDIYIENQRLSGHNVWQLRRKMVWVAQEPELGDQTVREVIERPFDYRANQHLQDNLQRLEHYMEMFALSRSVLKNSARTLSGGEKQRVALITAVLLERPIILLDEPSSALDPTSKQAVMDWISRAKQSILTVSHDRQWQSCADRVQDIESE